MYGEQIRTAKPNFIEIVDNVLNGFFVVQDHQSFFAILARSFFTKADQPLCLQDVIGVPLHAGRGPTEVDKELLKNAARIGPGGHTPAPWLTRLQKPLSVGLRQIPSFPRYISIKEFLAVKYWRALIVGSGQMRAHHCRSCDGIAGRAPLPRNF